MCTLLVELNLEIFTLHLQYKQSWSSMRKQGWLIHPSAFWPFFFNYLSSLVDWKESRFHGTIIKFKRWITMSPLEERLYQDLFLKLIIIANEISFLSAKRSIMLEMTIVNKVLWLLRFNASFIRELVLMPRDYTILVSNLII